MAAVSGGAGGGTAGRLAAVVPTIGASPHLERCLEALRCEGVETVVVHQGADEPPPAAARLAGRLLRLPANLGFAAATNRGIAETSGDYVATVNDDAVVEPGWAAALVAALDAEPRAAAAQGSNLRLDDPARLDGRGLAWNRWWQAVQVGHGEAVPAPSMPVERASGGAAATAGEVEPGVSPGKRAASPEEVFGVSATAAVYRRGALEAVASARGSRRRAADYGSAGQAGEAPVESEVFDPRLGAYYEDADLACRLRRAGWTALWVPAARTLHAGSVTGDRRRRWRVTRIYGNRWAVVARCLGRRFPAAMPRMAARDLADLALSLRRTDFATVAGIVAGWTRAARLLPGSIHGGRPVLPVSAPEPQ